MSKIICTQLKIIHIALY